MGSIGCRASKLRRQSTIGRSGSGSILTAADDSASVNGIELFVDGGAAQIGVSPEFNSASAKDGLGLDGGNPIPEAILNYRSVAGGCRDGRSLPCRERGGEGGSSRYRDRFAGCQAGWAILGVPTNQR